MTVPDGKGGDWPPEHPPRFTDLIWTTVGGEIQVSWGQGTAPANTLGRVDRQGYLVTTADDPAGQPKTDGREVARVTVSGHPAVITTTPPESTTGTWVSWLLDDGRRIHAWTQDADTNDALVAFADTLREQPTPLSRVFSLGLTLPGLTQQVSFAMPAAGRPSTPPATPISSPRPRRSPWWTARRRCPPRRWPRCSPWPGTTRRSTDRDRGPCGSG